MLNTNALSWEERVKEITLKDRRIIFELEPIKARLGIIYLFTDENKRMYIYVNGRPRSYGGWYMNGDLSRFDSVIADIYKQMRREYHIVKIEAFIPFVYLKSLYFPRNIIPSQRRIRKRIL